MHIIPAFLAVEGRKSMNTRERERLCVLCFPFRMESDSATLSERSIVVIKFGLQETGNNSDYTHNYLPSGHLPCLDPSVSRGKS